ncbi:MAG: hypothetical protein IKF91_04545 [Bacilli bacterium]|nr:hypothetical protein [Bacilli bacterium]
MKKILIILCFVFLCLTIHSISTSFGVFESKFDEDSSSSIAKWNIKVNNDNLNDTENTFYVDNISYVNSDNVNEDRFAPGVTGMFLLVIDPSDTEVSFKYDLSIDLSGNEYSQIKLDSIEGVDGTTLDVNSGVYSRVFSLSEIEAGRKDTIKVSFSWENDDANNESDSMLGQSSSTFEIPVNIKFTQYTE